MRASISKISIFCLFAFFLTSGAFFGAGMESGARVRSHRIQIELFPDEHKLEASDEMIIASRDGDIHLYLNKKFYVSSVLVDREEVAFSFFPQGEKKTSMQTDEVDVAADFSRAGCLVFSVESGIHSVVVSYAGELFDQPSTEEFSREYVANQSSGIIDVGGSFLPPESFWYPRAGEVMTRFFTATTTPAGYETVTQGKRLVHEETEGKLKVEWSNPHPSDSLFLQAGPYDVKQDEVEGIKVYTYFFKGGEKLSDLYLKKSKFYLEMYNRLLGPYPYEKFAVVENFFETGYGMPSWTLLGKTVVRLPFIPDTSLPHEICHNWWGNGVFIDYSHGNWCEGLTVYCADYLLKKKQSADDAADYRRQINRDYSSYVRDQNDFPLTAFRSRHNPATRAVGYGKTMMVFHDLQRMLGEETFFQVLRRLKEDFLFRSASWKDVLDLFEQEGGVNPDGFYRQWVEREGAPVLHLEAVSSRPVSGGYQVKLDVLQDGETYNLNVPVSVNTASGREEHRIILERASQTFTLQCGDRPLRLEIDPKHHLFRRLFPEEIPPSIAKVFGSASQLIILGSDEEKGRLAEFREASAMINRTKTARIQTDLETQAGDFEGNSIIILGKPAESTAAADLVSEVRRPLPPSCEDSTAAHVAVYFHPADMSLGILVMGANPGSAVLDVVRKLPHYGKYSYLVFHGGQNVDRGIWAVESSPLIYVFDTPR